MESIKTDSDISANDEDVNDEEGPSFGLCTRKSEKTNSRFKSMLKKTSTNFSERKK